MELIRIPSLVDNYIWLLTYQGNCIIVDPGTFKPVQQFLEQNAINPVAILLTHHHHDHVDGVKELQKYYPELVVYGPLETSSKGTTCVIKGGEQLNFACFSWQIFAVPGHTLGHVAYYQKPYLFCGDTLFSGGCGRIFEGTAEQMFNSIETLKALPDETLICCAHEYTAANMVFASYLLPYDEAIEAYTLSVNEKRAQKQSTLPSQLIVEKKINIFLRYDDPYLQKVLGFSTTIGSKCEVFAKIRKLKDSF
ncbi:Hydroxyacylglutathione hydrolase [Arsenophonus endosymbiont of Aleurodicus dispersus]|uniref:hydroxyacylglutathione hydrolase n=1 Tax=Arsenophonus endosymbiont of Aleurodicus dispersus TaxID=235559 RepID=UPI000EACA8D6|nr:hydroxyacylglutathione hydrolase [Arsenophonus endosymbiont of Aleurodicus dispersus]VAY02228.1 Hydroxyacylglutathione hydrolase [Arsenophonus endosymbiont of Aleurodicus dispersus]